MKMQLAHLVSQWGCSWDGLWGHTVCMHCFANPTRHTARNGSQNRDQREVVTLSWALAQLLGCPWLLRTGTTGKSVHK